MTTPGNHWYHCIGSTYGTWIRGDQRGWRARHHREHVDGDYKHPPAPDAHEQQRLLSTTGMIRSPVIFSPELCQCVCIAMGEHLMYMNVTWIDLCVSPTHLHLLMQCPSDPAAFPEMKREHLRKDLLDPLPRHIIGKLKKNAAIVLRKNGHRTAPGGVWAIRSHIIPIRDRQHQLQVVKYIRDHQHERAVVWSILKSTIPD